jgi:WD40 repeat protein
MADRGGQTDLLSLLRQSSVRLCDPRNPAHWGTGFFVASDVLLTCWHVVRDVPDQRVLVQQPRPNPTTDRDALPMALGEAILLERGDPWDLALLAFTPAGNAAGSDGERTETVVLPLQEQDPSLGSRLVTSAYPKDAVSRHDAIYEAAGRTTPRGQLREFLRIKADGVVPGFSGSALVDLDTGKVCGVVARNERTGGARDGGLAVPLAAFLDAFPEQGQALLRRNTVERHPGFTTAPKCHGRSDWSWPGGAWDFGPYRKERRQGFVGRDWLLQKVRAWAADPEAKQALLIEADFGVGKTAFLAKLLDHETETQTRVEAEGDSKHEAGPGVPVVAQHFCRWEENAYLSPGRFVQSLAAQLKEELPAYRKALEDDGATSLRESLNKAEAEPLRAFQQAVVAPLAKIPAPATRRLLVVDALDEALDHRPSGGGGTRYTIVDLLAKEARNLPPWLRLLATSRRRPEVVDPLRQGFFSIEEINAEEEGNLADIHNYVEARCQQEPLAAILSRAGLCASETAEVLQAKSGGKFLYAVRVLNDLASDAFTLENRQSLDDLPPGMDGFYEDTFNRRFPEASDYNPVKPLLALLCAQREPMGYGHLAAILKVSTDQIGLWVQPLEDLLRFQATPPSDRSSASGDEWRISFDHVSLEQWLTERSGGRIPRPRAGHFGVNREEAEQKIHAWAQAEVEANRAHSSPYLVRHLAEHLREEEHTEVLGPLLLNYPWLQARLEAAGINALLADFQLLELSPAIAQLEVALGQAAHLLSYRGDGWNGSDQLASQLLARVPLLGTHDALQALRQQAINALHQTGGARPLTSSILGQKALLRTLIGHTGPVYALAVLGDGRLASSSEDKSIRIWNPASGIRKVVLEGHTGGVTELIVLGDGRLASASSTRSQPALFSWWDPFTVPDDLDIRIWDTKTGSCTAVLKGHTDGVTALASWVDGRLVSASSDSTIRLWDADGSWTVVAEGLTHNVTALAILGDGRIASASSDATIRLWEPATGSCTTLPDEHKDRVTALAVLGDGRLVSASSDSTIRLWDHASDSCSAVFEGHKDKVTALAVLPDCRIASASSDCTIRLWNLDGSWTVVVEGLTYEVTALAILGDGRIASASSDGTIHVWDPAGSSSDDLEGHTGGATTLAILRDGRLASASSTYSTVWDETFASSTYPHDTTIRLWDPTTCSCSFAFESYMQGVSAMAVLGDGRLACASYDKAIRLWDPESNAFTAYLRGHSQAVNALMVLRNGQLATASSDTTIRIWDPATGFCTSVLTGHAGSVTALAVLGDGRLVSASEDTTIRLWHPASGFCTAVLEGHEDRVTALAVLGDGRLASASSDTTIRLWDPATGFCTILMGHKQGVSALSALSDGRLVSVSPDTTIRLWNLRLSGGSFDVLFVADAALLSLVWISSNRLLVAGDALGRLHWLQLPSYR